MSTIREIVEQVNGGYMNGTLEDEVIAALEAREQEKIDGLSQVALAHGIQPAVLAKVLVDLDFGVRTEDEKAFVTEQFENFKAEMLRQYSQATGIPVSLLHFPDTTPPEPGDLP